MDVPEIHPEQEALWVCPFACHCRGTRTNTVSSFYSYAGANTLWEADVGNSFPHRTSISEHGLGLIHIPTLLVLNASLLLVMKGAKTLKL